MTAGRREMTKYTAAELEATMERHAPSGFDPASDDMTVEFAIKLIEQDRLIEHLKESLLEASNRLAAFDDAVGAVRARAALSDRNGADNG